MKRALVCYFASDSAFLLWLSMSLIYGSVVMIRILYFGETINFVKVVMSTSELAHLWIPIIWGKYLFKNSADPH